MKILAVHPSPLMYTKIFLRLEPLGIELIAASARALGMTCASSTSRSSRRRGFLRIVRDWAPDAIAISNNYLANVPEVIELAKAARAICPEVFIFVGGHSASFVAGELLEHADGAIDCVLKGEGETSVVRLLEAAAAGDERGLLEVPGVVTRDGKGPAPGFIKRLEDVLPARDLLRHRRKYFIGVLDPCASIEFSRGCPWDCSFCSAWTFYGRSYRIKAAEAAAEELAGIREPGVFIVDDVAFIQGEHGMAIGEAIARRGIRKQFYLETRGDVLLRNKEVFRFWKTLGLQYMFLGVEAIDEEGLKRFRKRVTLSKNFEAIEFARSLGIMVAINIIADPVVGSPPVRGDPAVVPGDPRDRQYQREHAVPGHRELADRVAARDLARLPALRHPARRPADEAAPGRVLRRAGPDAAGLESQAPGLDRGQGAGRHPGGQPGPRADEYPEDALEVQQRLRSPAATGRPRAAGPLRDVTAAGTAGRHRSPGRSTSTPRRAGAAASSTTPPRPSSTRRG